MVNVFNTTLYKKAHDLLNIRDGGFLHNQISPIVTPVLEINRPISDVSFSLTKTTSGAGAIMTTRPDMNFMVTAVQLSFVKDATCDMADGEVSINTSVNGTSTKLLAMSCLTLTAQEMSTSLTFSAPIKVDRSTAINLSSGGTFSAGKFIRSACVHGYYSDRLN